ncbi:hypothetical protein BVG19_g3457 [[Candida] boidinii]|nr:hypothetical protein BVG19_g3457 [[Candida] boidinii]OWB51173.1 hypothetical protein B5S27_g2732 [[Candida] boidinii]
MSTTGYTNKSTNESIPADDNNGETKTIYYPKIDHSWELDEFSYSLKPQSKWSHKKIGLLISKINKISITNNYTHNHNSSTRFNSNRLSLNKLINLLNNVFGFNNFNIEILNIKILDNIIQDFKNDLSNDSNNDSNNDNNINGSKKYSVAVEIEIKLKLIDNTMIINKSIGKSQFYNSKYLSFSNAKKIAFTNGLKNCIYSLCDLLLEYEDKLKTNYYKPYK